jgi:hypothetical protein
MAKKDKIGKLYDWLPFGGLICVFVLIYIANVHRVEKKIRAIDHLHNDIEELKREYFSIKQKSWYNGTLNQVAKKVEGMDMTKKISIPKTIEKADVQS